MVGVSETADPANRAIYHREEVVDTLEGVDDYLGDDSLVYFRSRDIETDAPIRKNVIDGVLALVADAPEVLEDEYDADLDISASRWGQQPAETVWRVSRTGGDDGVGHTLSYACQRCAGGLLVAVREARKITVSCPACDWEMVLDA